MDLHVKHYFTTPHRPGFSTFNLNKVKFNDRHGTHKSKRNRVHFLVWIHYVAVSLWDLWEAGQVSLAGPSPFAVCLFSQPHRRQIDPPVCSPLQSHQCNQTSAAINHRLWTLCPARCHTHTNTYPHTETQSRVRRYRQMNSGVDSCTRTDLHAYTQIWKHTNVNGSAVTLAHTCTHICAGWHMYAHTRSLKWGIECWVVVLHKLRLSAQGA